MSSTAALIKHGGKLFPWSVLGLGYTLLVTSIHSNPTPASFEDNCTAAAATAGVNMSSFPHSVAHSIHSITVEDIHYFFDAGFSANNSIPTQQSKDKVKILPSALSFSSKYKLPGGYSFDRILKNSNVDGVTKTVLEEIVHMIHMHELYLKIAKIYKGIKPEAIDAPAVCPCLVDEKRNGILDALYIKELKELTAKQEEINTGEAMQVGNLKQWWSDYNANDAPHSSQLKYESAIYLFCKINY